MRTFYFTYGSSGQPFIGGWTEVNAPNYGAACAAFRAYHPDKTVQSKCENGEIYGVSLRPDAMAALYAHFAPEVVEQRKAAKKDAHRLTCRISARLETADYEALQQLIAADGYATTQDWLTAIVRRYIAKAGDAE